MPYKVAVIIPALNEEGNIGDLVRACLAQPAAFVIVADNGSTDNTAEVAKKAGAIVVSAPRRGYGYACAAGSAEARSRGAEILVFIDGDYSTLPGEIPQVIAPIENHAADLVLGSRILGDIEPGAMPAHQQFGNWLSARLMNGLYGVAVTDLGPFRAIRAPLLETLQMQEMTFGWPTEMTVKVARRKGLIHEVPVSWRRRKSGRSKVSGTIRGSILAAYYILGVILRYAL